jgi:hypothetical protein
MVKENQVVYILTVVMRKYKSASFAEMYKIFQISDGKPK